MTVPRAVALAALAALGAVAPAAAHHTGVYTPKDNAITANFKQVKFSVQGPLRAEMRARAAALPAGLEARTRAALAARDAGEAERGFMLFFVALARDLALEADHRLADGAPAAAVAPRFLEAIWRYYNLADFAVGQRDARASVAMRLAYDDAEGLARPAAAAPDPVRVRAAFGRIAQILSDLIVSTATPSTTTRSRRNS